MPGRREPGTGEINYPAVAAALEDMGYQGTVGLEAWASDGDSDRALARFRSAFTPGTLSRTRTVHAHSTTGSRSFRNHQSPGFRVPMIRRRFTGEP